jgi:hypothetical protein
MAKTPNYRELVVEAEQSVQGVKDPELRRIAFQKVLEELLGARPSSIKKAYVQGTRTDRKTSAGGPRAYLREMINDGFFKKPKAISDVKAELENRGHHIPITSLSGPLQTLCKKKELRRQRTDGRWVYSNW